MSSVFSSAKQLGKLETIVSNYMRLPLSSGSVPGAFLESALTHVHNAKLLNTYDYIDIHKRSKSVGWSIKSTKAGTPVTWKRAKLPNQTDLVRKSRNSSKGLQDLGNTIIRFCNEHAHASFARYDLQEIGYARLIVFPDGQVRYFEKKLCDRANRDIFAEEDFEWSWSRQKKTVKKEQLPALRKRPASPLLFSFA